MDVNGLADKRAYLAVLGCLLLEPMLIDDMDRPLDRADFNTEAFYEIVFSAINNLHARGCEVIDEFNIDSYLSSYKNQYAIFQENQGIEYLVNAKEMAKIENYDYYYHRVRKYSLLRYYENLGLDTRFIYDTTVVEPDAVRAENTKFDTLTEQDIVAMVETDFVITPVGNYCTNSLTTEIQAATGMRERIQQLTELPDVGVPLNNEGVNTIVRGGRKGCVYLRSATTGGGKSRLMVGDLCRMSVPYVYDTQEKKWVYTRWSEPTMYITTEMSPSVVQTMFISAVSKVNEEHILMSRCTPEEKERVNQAITYIESAPLYIVHIPDFSINDIKNLVKKYHRKYGVEYIGFDYIHTSLRLMSEITSKSRVGLKEYQLLLVFITELKALAEQLNVFILTSSQLNREAKDARYKDENLIEGSKQIANKVDVGMIALPPSPAELKRLEPILRHTIGAIIPNMGYWFYKVRGGQLTHIILWTWIDLGTMTEKPLFVTDNDFKLVEMDFTKIEQVEERLQEHSIPIAKVNEMEEEMPDTENEEEEKPAETMKFDW